MQRKQQRRRSSPAQDQQEKWVCSGCSHTLFETDKKFESGTGFPSFWLHIDDHVKQQFLDSYGQERTQLLCNQCGQHLGHLFPNKHTPTRLRYCINATAISLQKIA
ncbi:MAG: peptide-methionine (R)-S-oxide reductase [Bacteroidetes bacterium]|nr:peptide-methionine (R)-S-oxide reductase [Bacteroidota bacterium]